MFNFMNELVWFEIIFFGNSKWEDLRVLMGIFVSENKMEEEDIMWKVGREILI